MAEWQPINTAPRDGTRILASDYNVVTIVTWNNFGWRGWINGKGWSMSPVWWQPLPEHPPLPEVEHG